MSQTADPDDRTDGKRPRDREGTGHKLPVTAEVGDEGGSFADPTQQAETFSGVFGHPRVDPETVAAPGAEAGAVAPEEAGGEEDATVTPATERPERTR